MQDTQTTASSSQNAVLVPSCKLIDRFFALVIDCIFLAILLWVATHAFGTAQITSSGYNPATPDGLIDPGTTSGGYGFSLPNGASYSVNWTITLPWLWQALIAFLYFTLQETFFGRTLGKACMNLRVVSQIDENTYTHITLQAAILRNLLRFIDAIGMYLVGWIVSLVSPRRRRLGDIVARTLVVKAEDVLSIRPQRSQRVLGLHVMLALTLTFLLGCALFTYFGRPPLVVQNLVLTQPYTLSTQPPSEIIHISRYTLGQASWGRDTQGEPTITYPITYMAVYQTTDPSTSRVEEKGQLCNGSITLVWRWWAFDWELLTWGNGCTGV